MKKIKTECFSPVIALASNLVCWIFLNLWSSKINLLQFVLNKIKYNEMISLKNGCSVISSSHFASTILWGWISWSWLSDVQIVINLELTCSDDSVYLFTGLFRHKQAKWTVCFTQWSNGCHDLRILPPHTKGNSIMRLFSFVLFIH